MLKFLDNKIDAAIRGAVQGGMIALMLWIFDARVEIIIPMMGHGVQ